MREKKRGNFDGAFCKQFKLVVDRVSSFVTLNVENRWRKWSKIAKPRQN